MKRLIVPLFMVIAAAAFASASSASAQEGRHLSPQQEKFAACAHQSKGMKREEHKKFMSECLKGKSVMGKMMAKQHKTAGKAHEMESRAGGNKMMSWREKMKTCNTEAKNKKLMGKDRKTFMSKCLKGGK